MRGFILLHDDNVTELSSCYCDMTWWLVSEFLSKWACDGHCWDQWRAASAHVHVLELVVQLLFIVSNCTPVLPVFLAHNYMQVLQIEIWQASVKMCSVLKPRPRHCRDWRHTELKTWAQTWNFQYWWNMSFHLTEWIVNRILEDCHCLLFRIPLFCGNGI